MVEFGMLGYLVAAFGFAVLSFLLLTSWRGQIQAVLLAIASILTCIWLVVAGYQTNQLISFSIPLILLELLHSGVWVAFLAFLIKRRAPEQKLERGLIVLVSTLVAVVVTNIVVVLLPVLTGSLPNFNAGFNFAVLSQLLMSVCGLVFAEQLFRNATTGERWSLKYLCFGVGGLFAYDFYLYSDALLLRAIDAEIWQARGYIHIISIPLIGIAASRNPHWSIDVSISRRMVFHTGTLIAAGIYLLVMAAGGYYIKQFGGSWGGIAQLIFLFASFVILALLFFSGQLRSRFRMLINKHFFNYRYDYRDEWLKFTDALSDEKLDSNLPLRAISAIADLVDSPGGMLWVKSNGEYRFKANWNVKLMDTQLTHSIELDYFTELLQDESQVIDLTDEDVWNTNVYLNRPRWFDNIIDAWLIVPLLQHEQLYGFIVLTLPRAQMNINWENRDLLMTTGRQVTNYLALLEATESLVEAEQFEAFNRLSAFVVHDLKNVVAQLGLIVKNASKHKGKPEFVDDAFSTVENSVLKMNKMLAQLRKPQVETEALQRVNLCQIIQNAIENQSGEKPMPISTSGNDAIYVLADVDRLTSVLQHLILNAQEATEESGFVNVRYWQQKDQAIIEIEDNGEGMDTNFINTRLFKPFETTKGNAGMGIGAYESREIIRSFNGSLYVASVPRKGTTITILLKIHALLGDEKAIPLPQ